MAEFAGFERILGQQVFPVRGSYWKRVRLLFYRPLLPFQEFEPGSAGFPFLAFLGGVQHAVPLAEQGNSFLNYLMFEDAQAYVLDSLDYNRKRQVKQAAKKFEVRPVSDINEFKEKAYPAYLSFLERTQYQYGSRRKDRSFFCQWADKLFKIPQAVILGGYREGVLNGVSVSLLVEGTLCYTMFFCDTESLRLGLSDLMLHSVRQAVAESRCANRIFAGLYKGGKGLDDFYLLRGCQLVKKPALLRLNPVAGFLLKCCWPAYYARLSGRFEANGGRGRGNSGTTHFAGTATPPGGRKIHAAAKEEAKTAEPADDAAHHQAVFLESR
jgi:hypothetical protein